MDKRRDKSAHHSSMKRRTSRQAETRLEMGYSEMMTRLSENGMTDPIFKVEFEPEASTGILRYTGPRPSHAAALRLCMQKWEALRQACLRGMLVDDGGVKTCGLCMLYFYGSSEECEYCPISEEGYPGCMDTPARSYPDAVKAGSVEQALREAERELVFLRLLHSRRPPPENP